MKRSQLGIAETACNAAIELDNYQLGRNDDFTCLGAVIDWLEEVLQQYQPSINPLPLMRVADFVQRHWSKRELEYMSELAAELERLIGELKSTREKLSTGKLDLEESCRWRDLMLALSKNILARESGHFRRRLTA